MSNKPLYGPAPGERVRVRAGRTYPLPAGLPDRAVVLLKEWHSPGYTAEYVGDSKSEQFGQLHHR